MNPPDLTDARAALDASQATRAAVRSLPPDDPDRIAALHAALGSLRETWTDAHRTYVRQGPRNGRTGKSADPVVTFGHDRTKETRLVHKMLKPSSGTPYQARSDRRTADQMAAHLARSVGYLRQLDDDHERIRRLFGGGSWTPTKGGGRFRNMRELHAEARELADALHEHRAGLNAAWSAYERHLASGQASRADARRFAPLSARLDLWRQDADKLHAELRKSLRRETPIPRPRERWAADSARSALRGFVALNGRMPRKAECHPDFNLPHYTQLRRLLGPRPLGGG